MKTISKIQEGKIMRRKLKVIALSLFVSMSVAGCGNSASETVTANAVTTTSSEIESAPEEKEASNGLLPFGFTPKEFHNNFADFASYLDITTDDLKRVTDNNFGFAAHSAAGDDIIILLLSDSDGKVIDISIPSDYVSKGSFSDIAEATLLSTDILLDFNEIDKTLVFGSAPKTRDDYRYCNSNGIKISLSATGLSLIRDSDSPDEYSYTKNNTYPKGKEKNDTDSAIAPSESEKSVSAESVPESKDVLSEITTGQKNALSKAHDYLNYSAFSYSGLIEQLEYEGFTPEEATYAADNCGADWNNQASKKALDYLIYSAFSYSGLIEQLEYEGFSTVEATYAADNCGADWNEQAAKKAQDYLDYSSFSRSGLIDQLKYEGFTNEQAEHGASAAGY